MTDQTDLIISCGVLLFRQQPSKQFLLMRHPTRWDLPKGHLDSGETQLQCALRELQEETGIPPSAISLDPNFRFHLDYYVQKAKQLRPKRLVIFMGQLIQPVKISVTEHHDFKWFDWNPPHSIQLRTIDPLLSAVEQYKAGKRDTQS